MGISNIADEVARKGFYRESALSLINGDLLGARSLDDIADAAKKEGLVITTEPWINPERKESMDHLVTFRKMPPPPN